VALYILARFTHCASVSADATIVETQLNDILFVCMLFFLMYSCVPGHAHDVMGHDVMQCARE
jgi:hypothetical protein